jgi:hypothetical protein
MFALNLLLAAVLLALAAYAQHRIAFFTAGSGKTALTRAVLAVVGLLAGWVGAAYAPPGLGWIAFIQGFGVVHLPAALILFLKRARHESPS